MVKSVSIICCTTRACPNRSRWRCLPGPDLWDQRALLLELFEQSEWQRVMALRMELARMLMEGGARSVFEPRHAMGVVAKRAAQAAEGGGHADGLALARAPGAPGPSTIDAAADAGENSKYGWAERALENGGAPAYFGGWVWPSDAEVGTSTYCPPHQPAHGVPSSTAWCTGDRHVIHHIVHHATSSST
jgi:hypothetical protein